MACLQLWHAALVSDGAPEVGQQVEQGQTVWQWLSIDGLDYGSLPAWAAVTAAVVAALYTAAAHRREKRRDKLNTEVRLREQANKVAAWPSMVKRFDDDPRPARPGYRIRNSSDLPVLNLRLELRRDSGPRRGLVLFQQYYPVLAPGGEVSLPTPSSVDGEPIGIDNDVVWTIAFIDAQGVWWVRSSEGKLEPLDDEDKQPAWWRAFTAQDVLFPVLRAVLNMLLPGAGDGIRRRRR